jgi:two-component system phosphate regulon sensor histidine kinase PhoR
VDAFAVALAVVAAAAAYAVGARRAADRARRRAEATAARVAGALEERLSAARHDLDAERSFRDALMAVVSDGVLVLDTSEKVTASNEIAEAWFHLRPEGGASLVSATGSAELRDAVRDAWSGEAPLGVPSDIYIANHVFSARIRPTVDGGAVLALRDDTELHRLLRSSRDLLANVSHDLRTPLTSLGLLVDMLPSELSPSRRADVTRQMREQVDTLQALADVLVEVDRLESGRVLLRLQEVDVDSLVATAVAEMSPQLERARLAVVTEVEADQRVLADPPQVARVLRNLLDNAVRHSSDGGTVRIGCRRDPDPERIELFVADEGPGIPRADADRVFERFFVGDPSRSALSRGLGLAIARHIVEGHGGRIWVDPTVSRGATVRFTLPAA